MRLTGFTDVGLRILIRLAAEDGRRRISTRQIAEDMQISYTHATKACAHLAASGWLDADRGRGGGLALTAGGRTARLGDVVRSLEDDDDSELVDCSGLDCPLQSGCRLRAALAVARAAFYASLNTTTVADLAQPPARNLLISLGAPAAQIDSRAD
ncbi:Rrf2 family transcriptional regulator [Mycolicibacterium mucogenicum]|uniref:RrF2 family transcriptional regulator n=1 Tax=Mycolicibacterium mucogenicum TaxID=56689 RepID=UPI002269F92F|nr:Rrf2 family transcriptional regulator [Mycolicibacterium mucogenicum]MCX8560581.1 Rrf2 family transcriptional regulator [Mycolicibacterium mucogenicum]